MFSAEYFYKVSVADEEHWHDEAQKIDQTDQAGLVDLHSSLTATTIEFIKTAAKDYSSELHTKRDRPVTSNQSDPPHCFEVLAVLVRVVCQSEVREHKVTVDHKDQQTGKRCNLDRKCI